MKYFGVSIGEGGYGIGEILEGENWGRMDDGVYIKMGLVYVEVFHVFQIVDNKVVYLT